MGWLTAVAAFINAASMSGTEILQGTTPSTGPCLAAFIAFVCDETPSCKCQPTSFPSTPSSSATTGSILLSSCPYPGCRRRRRRATSIRIRKLITQRDGFTSVRNLGASGVLNALSSSYRSVRRQPRIIEPSRRCSCLYQSSNSASSAGVISAESTISGCAGHMSAEHRSETHGLAHCRAHLLARESERPCRSECRTKRDPKHYEILGKYRRS